MYVHTHTNTHIYVLGNSLESIRNDHSLCLVIWWWNTFVNLQTSKCSRSSLSLVRDHPIKKIDKWHEKKTDYFQHIKFNYNVQITEKSSSTTLAWKYNIRSPCSSLIFEKIAYSIHRKYIKKLRTSSSRSPNMHILSYQQWKTCISL